MKKDLKIEDVLEKARKRWDKLQNGPSGNNPISALIHEQELLKELFGKENLENKEQISKSIYDEFYELSEKARGYFAHYEWNSKIIPGVSSEIKFELTFRQPNTIIMYHFANDFLRKIVNND